MNTPPEDTIKDSEYGNPEFVDKLIQSIAPELIGLDYIKKALLLQQVASDTTQSPRTSIHILLVGDYGTGKTHLINTVKQINHTNLTKLRLIDNLNTYSKDELRTLEDTIENNPSVSVLAACNPRLGRYNTYQTIVDNIALPGWLLSGFDLIYLLRDNPDRFKDQVIAEKILEIGQEKTQTPYNQKTVNEYLKAASRIKPELSQFSKKKLLSFYLNLRNRDKCTQVVAITPRQLNTLIKLTTANAKLHHRTIATEADAEVAINILTTSLEQIGVDPDYQTYDIDTIYTGRPTVLNSKLLHLVEVFSELEKLSTQVKDIDIQSMMFERYGYSRRTVNRLLRTLVHEEIIRMDSPGVYTRIR